MKDTLYCKNCGWVLRADTERYHIQSEKEFNSGKKVSTHLWRCTKCDVIAIGNTKIDWYEGFGIDLDNPFPKEIEKELYDSYDPCFEDTLDDLL